MVEPEFGAGDLMSSVASAPVGSLCLSEVFWQVACGWAACICPRESGNGESLRVGGLPGHLISMACRWTGV